MSIDRLIDGIIERQNPTALGLDTRIEYLPKKILEKYPDLSLDQAVGLITDYNIALIDSLSDIIPCVKVQIAFYEMYGIPGMKAFADTIEYAKKKGLVVIADVKRNDIGSTADAYADAYLGETSINGKKMRMFDADFITVNAYLGEDGIHPFLKRCEQYKKGIFVLVKTSNPSSGQIQDLICNNAPIYETIGGLVIAWGSSLIGKYGYSEVGAVVGATYPEQSEELRKKMSCVFFLLPGYGAQGATGKDLVGGFDSNGIGSVVNASRSLLCAHTKENYSDLSFTEAARAEALVMKEDIIRSLTDSGKPMISKKLDF